MHSFINWIGCVAHPWIGNWEWEFFPCSVAAAAAAAAAVVVAVAAVAVAAVAEQPTAVSTNSCLSTSHLHHRCSVSRTPAAGSGRNILQSGRLLNIPAAAAGNQLGEVRAAESLVGRSQAELLPVALHPGNP